MIEKETRDLLPDIIRETMDALSANTNAPDELSLPVTLAIASFACQGIANGYPMQWNECPINNFFTVLVPSGGLKTSTSDALLEGAKRFEEEQRPKAEEAWTDYQIGMKKYTNEVNDKAKKKPGIAMPGVIPASPTPFDKIEKPMFPRTFRYMMSKFTLNGLFNTLQGVPHVGMFNSDAAEFFNSHSFKDETTSVEIVSAMSRLWSGENVDKITGVEDIQTRGKRTTALFMLQQELAGFLSNSAFKDQGFTNRMLITQCELIGKKRADFSSAGLSKIITNNDNLIPFNDRVYQLLTTVDKQQQKPTGNTLLDMRKKLEADNNGGKINPNILSLGKIDYEDDAARMVMQDFYNEMVDAAFDPKYEEYKNFIARAYEHCVRIATVLTVFDLKPRVTVREAQCAVGLMHYFIDQRLNLNIDGIIKVDPIVDCAEKMRTFLKGCDPAEKMTKTMLNNNGPSSYRKMNTKQRSLVIDEMIAREWIEAVHDKPMYIKLK